jgi:hypothetical protein
MAAFCACCGAEITLKQEACTVCGMPRHGMLAADCLPAPDLGSSSPAARLGDPASDCDGLS